MIIDKSFFALLSFARSRLNVCAGRVGTNLGENIAQYAGSWPVFSVASAPFLICAAQLSVRSNPHEMAMQINRN